MNNFNVNWRKHKCIHACILLIHEPKRYIAKEKKGYCEESEIGALNRALSGIDATNCAILDTAGLNRSLIESSEWQNSLAIWSTPSFSSKQSKINLS
jgi:hypothetical protein